MAERIEKFALVAAAGAGATFQDHTFLDGTVTRVEVTLPAGHAGLTTWSFWYGSGQIIPKTAASSIVGDDETFEWDVDELPTGAIGGAGSGYRSRYSNADVFPHTFHIQVWLDELVAVVAGDTPSVFLLPAQ
jgi:hypothetical protein